MKHVNYAFAFALAMTVSFVALAAESKDPVVGTWQLNLQKSKFAPDPPPKSQTRTYASEGDRITMTAEGVDAKGNHTSQEWSAKYDGKDYPITGSPLFDSIALKRQGDTVIATTKKQGKPVATGTRVISDDGKEMRLTTKGTNEKGEPYTSVMVFDKR
jgi:hypothetical protein